MDDDVLAKVVFFPGKVVVVLDVEQDLSSEVGGDGLMNHGMIGGGVLAHEFHGVPVFLSGFGVEVEPGEAGDFVREVGVELNGEFAVVVADGGAGTAAAAMAEQGEVKAGREGQVGGSDFESAELDEVVAGTAGAKLGPGLVLELAGDRGDGPVGVHDGMLASVRETGTDAKAGFGFNGGDESVGAGFDAPDGEIEHGHLHAAGDIHTDGVRDDGVVGGEDAADGQAIADMGIGHQCASYGDGESAGLFHLLDCLRVEITAPLVVVRRWVLEGRAGLEEGPGEGAAKGVLGVSRRVGENGADFVLDAGAIESFEAVIGDEVIGPADWASEGDAQSDEVRRGHDQDGA